MTRKFTQEQLNYIKIIVDSEINVKLNMLINSGFIPVEDPSHFRSVARQIVERSVHAWGFTPDDISVIGPNDDSKITIGFTINTEIENSLLG
jgi:hypothetical protein